MLIIPEENYINKGGFQKCYVHPEDENLCIKIKIDENHEDPRVDREIKYIKKIQKKKVKNPFWARFHGTVDTNIGVGYVFDLIRDETTNEVSTTVSEYLKLENCPISYKDLEFEFQRIKNLMIKHKIIVRDMSGKNVCCRKYKDNSIELVVIDGLGHRDFFPLVDFLHCSAKRKINKIYNKRHVNSMVAHRKWLSTRW